MASTKASFGGTQVPSIAEGSRPTRPSYARAAHIDVTSTTQTPRQTVSASMVSSVTSGDNRNVNRGIPPLMGHVSGQSTVASGDNRSVNRGIPPLRGHVSGQNTVAPTTTTTASDHHRPQLRGMSGQDPSLMTFPHLGGVQQTNPSTDSRADVESLVSSSAVSTRPSPAQPSDVQGYNAFAPRGDRPRQTTGEVPSNSSKAKKPRVGPSGWLKLVGYLESALPLQ